MLLSSNSKIIKNQRAENGGEFKFENIEYIIEHPEEEMDEEIEIDIDEESINEKIEALGDGISVEELKDSLRGEVFAEIKKEKEKILKKAVEKADEIEEAAKVKGYSEGFEKGKEEGLKEGLKKAEEESLELKEDAVKLFEESEKKVEEYYEDHRKNIINLSVAIAESIINMKLDDDKENIINLARPIIDNYSDLDRVVLRCNSSKYNVLNEYIKSLKEEYPKTKFYILNDDSLEENDIIIENDEQTIDLSIKRQLESIIKSLESVE